MEWRAHQFQRRMTVPETLFPGLVIVPVVRSRLCPRRCYSSSPLRSSPLRCRHQLKYAETRHTRCQRLTPCSSHSLSVFHATSGCIDGCVLSLAVSSALSFSASGRCGSTFHLRLSRPRRVRAVVIPSVSLDGGQGCGAPARVCTHTRAGTQVTGVCTSSSTCLSLVLVMVIHVAQTVAISLCSLGVANDMVYAAFLDEISQRG